MITWDPNVASGSEENRGLRSGIRRKCPQYAEPTPFSVAGHSKTEVPDWWGLVPWGHVAMSGDLFGRHSLCDWLVVGRDQGPAEHCGLHRTPSDDRELPVLCVNNAVVETPVLRDATKKRGPRRGEGRTEDGEEETTAGADCR